MSPPCLGSLKVKIEMNAGIPVAAELSSKKSSRVPLVPTPVAAAEKCPPCSRLVFEDDGWGGQGHGIDFIQGYSQSGILNSDLQ